MDLPAKVYVTVHVNRAKNSVNMHDEKQRTDNEGAALKIPCLNIITKSSLKDSIVLIF